MSTVVAQIGAVFGLACIFIGFVGFFAFGWKNVKKAGSVRALTTGVFLGLLIALGFGAFGLSAASLLGFF